ncbi:MAG: 23S rRNA (pseudouridine(1915)-N(3))-methyltransferase RlmH [Candidatus Peregrinibacteria bacterium]
MQKITLLAVGTVKTPWVKEAIAAYVNRLQPLCSLNVVELPASKKKEEHQQIGDESERILSAFDSLKGEIWVLDERGVQMTSVQFAQDLGRLRDRGESVTFIIGGAYGFDDRVRKRAHRLISLSSMTLAHEFVRPLLLEQIYRAMTILQGRGYHH